jgi:formate hydrogenlyase subunit 3/multisubunit Na+/H+ antiporter MnhD subunit
MKVLLATALLLPLLLAALVCVPVSARGTRALAGALAPWAPLPALALALTAAPGLTLDVPWLLLGAQFGLDATTRVFLFFTSALWLCGGLYARSYLAGDPRRARFTGLFALTCAGNLGLVLAQDIAGFYAFFALMTFSAYGLVVHEPNAAARRAGRVYLVMAVGGEALLLTGFLLLADNARTLDITQAAAALANAPAREAIVGLLLAGFGVKAGAVLLHLWLPLAHPVAPTPASAVLSGAILKAGLLGWLRFLPLGAVALPETGAIVVAAGLAAAFYGVAIGVAQRDAKVVLAYSSISQMGLMSVGVGAGLLAPQAWPALLPAVTLYALHHALAKGSLFLGVGVAARGGGAWHAVLLGQALPALALAGAPLSSGALAKSLLTEGLASLPAPWPTGLAWLLPLAAVGTSVLMLRFLFVLAAQRPTARAALPGLWLPWWLPLCFWLLAAAWLAPTAPWAGMTGHTAVALAPAALWAGTWPVAAGVGVAWLALRPRFGRLRREAPAIPPGDLLVPCERAWQWCTQAVRSRRGAARERRRLPRPAWVAWVVPAAVRFDATLCSWRVAGALLLVLLLLAVGLLALG